MKKTQVAKRTLKAACVGLLATPLLLMSEPVSAGSNGQQVKVDIGWGRAGRTVTVSGYNQNGQYVRWTGTTNSWGAAETHGWWWKGNASVQVHPKWPSWGKTCGANVPINQSWSNWFTITCRP